MEAQMENQLIPKKEEFDIYQTMAKKAFESKYFDKLGGEAGILSIMLMAREMGLPPMQCIMDGMQNIQGKIVLSPRLMNSMIRKAGHKMEIESTDKFCKIKGIRSDTDESSTVVFTIEEADRAGLLRPNSPWTKYPSDMLFARCLSRLARRLFADVISTAYVEGEIEEKPTSPESKSNDITIQEPEKPKSPIQPHVEAKFCLNEDQVKLVEKLIGPDEDFKQIILKGYGVSELCKIELTSTGFISFINRLKELNEERLKSEMSNA